MIYRNRLLCLICVACIAGIASQANAQSPGDGNLQSKMVPAATLLAKEAAEIQAQINEFEALISQTQSQLSLQFDRVNKSSVSDIAFEEVYRMLHLQNAELNIDLEGLGARLELLKSNAVSKKENGNANNTQRELLRKYVENQAAQLQTVKRLSVKGARPAQDVKKAESLLMEAQLKLEQFEANSRKASPAMVDAIFETSLEIAEKKARLEAVRKMLANHTDARSAVYDIAELKEQVASEKLMLRKLTIRLKDTKRRLAAEKDGE